jgi:hypothetical protein
MWRKSSKKKPCKRHIFSPEKLDRLCRFFRNPVKNIITHPRKNLAWEGKSGSTHYRPTTSSSQHPLPGPYLGISVHIWCSRSTGRNVNISDTLITRLNSTPLLLVFLISWLKSSSQLLFFLITLVETAAYSCYTSWSADRPAAYNCFSSWWVN